MSRQISIKDIASHVGTSITTVSFVINGKAKEKHISEKVAKKILDFISEVGYKPNSIARGLRTGNSKTIGFLVDDISKPFFSSIASVIDEKAALYGYNIISSSIGTKNKSARSILDIFAERRVDGYIIAVTDGIEDEVAKLVEGGRPVVLFDRYLEGIKADYVLTDNLLATRDATCHLIDNGYKNIGFITIETTQQQMVDRLQGYLETVNESNLQSFVLKIDYQNALNPADEIKQFLIDNPEIDSLIFSTNYLTKQGLKLLISGEDKLLLSKALVSFDDFELLEYIKPPLTAVEQPIEALADNIINLLIKKITEGAKGAKQEESIVKLKAKLKIRESTMPK
ncbi:LacI family DNA-binding transcriptional regulator [Pedobacter mucosus]|uniref:LacI family DNA-binding transcriptional regulator n=1 Tax=Pedobacter mucosus TaxID=2895286 RepID=UPI001EE3D18F|nr:LacI family DNA-binding transcriptional regulator [Pedobacter mucosus]UKT64952.1 LacI family transcriptional regulator [Pedobacter mucosus]